MTEAEQVAVLVIPAVVGAVIGAFFGVFLSAAWAFIAPLYRRYRFGGPPGIVSVLTGAGIGSPIKVLCRSDGSYEIGPIYLRNNDGVCVFCKKIAVWQNGDATCSWECTQKFLESNDIVLPESFIEAMGQRLLGCGPFSAKKKFETQKPTKATPEKTH